MAILGRIRKKKDGSSSPSSQPSSRNVSAASHVSNLSASSTSTSGEKDKDKEKERVDYDANGRAQTPRSQTPQMVFSPSGSAAVHALSTSTTPPTQVQGQGQGQGQTQTQIGQMGQAQGAAQGHGPLSASSSTAQQPVLVQNVPQNLPPNVPQQVHQPTPPAQSPRRVLSNQYPWSQHFISNASPFPRYGHAANYIAARDGEVFVMGGLKGADVFGDLWVIESDTLVGYLLDTDGCPSPRVGHASLTLGNAFIVFGGDTKVHDTDTLDDALYLLNTTTLKWTRVTPGGSAKPCGRYGHTLSAIGSKIYVFGGQMDDVFFNDLVEYDLTTLRAPDSQWRRPVLTQSAVVPPARTNHTVVTYQDKLYLFGGTDGQFWYSDVWVFDPREPSWTQLECSGFLPSPCEGHAATVVGDIMYVFGGRSSTGEDLSTLSALKLTSRKWFTFQNLGPGPTPRAGHSMTAFGHKILVMGGEGESDAEQDPVNGDPASSTSLDSTARSGAAVYVLDTSRITYPPDRQQKSGVKESPKSMTGTPVSQIQVAKTNNMNGGNYKSGYNNNIINRSYGDIPETVVVDKTLVNDNDKDAAVVSKNLNKNLDLAFDETAPPSSHNHRKFADRNVGSNTALASAALAGSGISIPPSASAKSLGAPFDDKSREHSIINSYEYDEDDLKSQTTYESAENLQNQLDQDLSSTEQFDTTATNIVSPVKTSSPPTLLTATPRGPQTQPSLSTSATTATNANANVADTSYSEDVATPTLSDSVAHHAQEDMDTTISKSPTLVSDKSSQVETRDQALEQLKASNSWYESELAAAKAAGYVPSSRPPVDVLKLRRVSQRITQDTSSSLAERDILMAAMQEMKQELQNVQERFQQQAEAASIRIKSIEQERDEYKRQAEDHPATRDLHQQLQAHSDKVLLLEHERSHLSQELTKWQTHAKDIEQTTDTHVSTLKTTAEALSQAQSQVALLNKQVHELSESNSELRTKNADLSAKVAQLEAQLEDHQEQSQKFKGLAEEHAASADKSHLALTSGITSLVALWNEKKALHQESTRSVDDSRAELEEKLRDVHEQHSTEVTALQQELDQLKKQLEELQISASSHEERSTTLQKQLEDHTVQQQGHLQKIQEYESKLGALQQEHETKTASLAKDGDSRVKAVQDEYEARIKELEQQYESSLQVFENQEVAFKKLREELSKYKDVNSKLQEQLDELKLQQQDDDSLHSEKDVSSSTNTNTNSTPVLGTRISSLDSPKYNQRNMELQLKDVKLQLVMLQEEKDEMEAKVKELRKKQYSKDSELQELKSQNEFLQSKLETFVSSAGGQANSTEQAAQIDTFNDELEELRMNRPKLSTSSP